MDLDLRGVTLIFGRPGVGKTTLAMRIAQERIKKGEKVFWVSLHEDRKTLLKNASMLGYDLSTIDFLDLIFVKPEAMANQVVSAVSHGEYNLIVVDSVSSLLENISRDYLINTVYRMFKSAGVDFVAIAEEEATTPLDYIADTVLHLTMSIDELITERRMYILKSRGRRAGYYVEFDILEGQGLVFVDEIPKPPQKNKWSAWIDTISGAIGEVKSGGVYLFQGVRATHILTKIAADLSKQGYRVLYRVFSRDDLDIYTQIEKHGGNVIVQRVEPHKRSYFMHMQSLYESLRDLDVDVLISDGIDVEFLLYGEKALYINLRETEDIRNAGVTLFFSATRTWGLGAVADVVAYFKGNHAIIHGPYGRKVCKIEDKVVC